MDALHEYFNLGDALTNKLVPITSELGPKPEISVIDLRQPVDFQAFHLLGSINVPFVKEETPSPFSNPEVLESLWTKMEDTFKAPSKELMAHLKGKQVLVLCYDGDSARVATSVLRAKGHEADSLKGGFQALRKLRGTSREPTHAMNGLVNGGLVASPAGQVAVATQAA